MKKKISFILVLCTSIISTNIMAQKRQLKYVALGDSYTIGEGATLQESFPVLLTRDLNAHGINTKLVANPSKTGWTTQDLIDNELNVCEKLKPDFVTLLIGVNDWVQGVDSATFHKNLTFILNKVESLLPNKKNLVLITIPDFGVTPAGAMYSEGRNISAGIADFNLIIESEAKKRGLICVDIYPETQKMKGNTQLIAKDGLHPSAIEYAIWEKIIFPVIYSLLSK